MSCDCGPVLKSLSSSQLAALKNHITATANKRSIKLGATMEATQTTETANAEVAKPAEVAAVAASTIVNEVEMVALSEKKAVDDKLTAKEAEFTALQAKSSADIVEILAKAEQAAKEAKTAADAELAKLNGQLTASSSLLVEYQKLVEAAIPQEMLNDAVLKAASGIVEGYDATKKVAEQTPATITKLLKFSETVKQASQSTNAGAVETSGKSRKKPDMNLVFPGITIKKKKTE